MKRAEILLRLCPLMMKSKKRNKLNEGGLSVIGMIWIGSSPSLISSSTSSVGGMGRTNRPPRGNDDQSYGEYASKVGTNRDVFFDWNFRVVGDQRWGFLEMLIFMFALLNFRDFQFSCLIKFSGESKGFIFHRNFFALHWNIFFFFVHCTNCWFEEVLLRNPKETFWNWR